MYCSPFSTYSFAYRYIQLLKLAKYLSDLLTPLIPTEHCTKDNTFTFVEELKKVRTTNSFLVSFDVESLFTNIPLDETISLAVDLILSNNPNIKTTRAELSRLFEFCTKQTHFFLNDQLYDQLDGVAMGSLLAPALANLFLGHHEANWLLNIKDMLMISSAFFMMKEMFNPFSTLLTVNTQTSNSVSKNKSMSSSVS